MDQNSMTFLLSHDAKAQRVARLDGYPLIGEVRPIIVVHVEVQSRSFIELDADDVDHAKRLVKTWIRDRGNISARFHFVTKDGSLTLPSKIFDFRDFDDA